MDIPMRLYTQLQNYHTNHAVHVASYPGSFRGRKKKKKTGIKEHVHGYSNAFVHTIAELPYQSCCSCSLVPRLFPGEEKEPGTHCMRMRMRVIAAEFRILLRYVRKFMTSHQSATLAVNLVDQIWSCFYALFTPGSRESWILFYVSQT